MARFTLLLIGGNFDELSAAETEAAYGKYYAWTKKLREEGRYVNAEELESKGKIVRPGLVSDGPYVESKEALGGYYTVNAESLDDAVELAKTCPQLEYGGYIDVRPVIDHS